jgi:hypothetical protein
MECEEKDGLGMVVPRNPVLLSRSIGGNCVIDQVVGDHVFWSFLLVRLQKGNGNLTIKYSERQAVLNGI